MAAFGSFIGGTIAVILLTLVAPPLANFALKFGPPENFSLVILGLVVVSFLARGSMVKAMIMAAFGLFLGSIGIDIIEGSPKFTVGVITFMDGIGLLPVVMGLFGISEVLLNIEQGVAREVFTQKITNLLPNRQDWKDSIKPIGPGDHSGIFAGDYSRGRSDDCFFHILCC